MMRIERRTTIAGAPALSACASYPSLSRGSNRYGGSPERCWPKSAISTKSSAARRYVHSELRLDSTVAPATMVYALGENLTRYAKGGLIEEMGRQRRPTPVGPRECAQLVPFQWCTQTDSQLASAP